MKKISLMIIICLSSSSFLFAGSVEENLGKCGVGSYIWGSRSGILSHVFAISSNTIFNVGSTKYSSITSGTSGCTKFKSLVFDQKTDLFISENMANLASDIARGEGEYLDTLAILMEVNKNERMAFNKKLQDNFVLIYSSSNVTSQEVAENIKGVIKG